MISDSEAINRVPRNWLVTDVKYQGWGKAVFTGPPGTVEGPALVHVDRFGEQGDHQRKESSGTRGVLLRQWISPLRECSPAGVRQPMCCGDGDDHTDGLFSATESIRFDGGNTRSKPHRIRLRLLRSQFEVNGIHQAAYWVLPLSNFILSWWPRLSPDVDSHPLRVSKEKGAASAYLLPHPPSCLIACLIVAMGRKR